MTHQTANNKVVFSTCIYKPSQIPYVEELQKHVEHLVIYTEFDLSYKTPITVVKKSLHEYSTFKMVNLLIGIETWINNTDSHANWQKTLLKCEKLNFLKETASLIPDADYYGWIDCDYFKPQSIEKSVWPNVSDLTPGKIVYGCVSNNDHYIEELKHMVLTKQTVPLYQRSIICNFYLVPAEQLDWWHSVYYRKMAEFLMHSMVLSDELITMHGVFEHLERFSIFREFDKSKNNKYMFQRIL